MMRNHVVHWCDIAQQGAERSTDIRSINATEDLVNSEIIDTMVSHFDPNVAV